jgi:serine/threonine protein kinase
MGVVYMAEDIKLNRTVALKLLPLELTSDSESKEHLLREAQAGSALNNGIQTIFYIKEDLRW